MKRIKVGTEADKKVQAIKKKLVRLRNSKGYLLKNKIALKRNEELKQQLREVFEKEGEEVGQA